MSIGLYDGDIKTYPSAAFNLELMKYATYYKKKNQVVTLTPYLQPERYTTFIYRQDYPSSTYPTKILKNSIYGGYAFTNGLYVPLDENIERQPPDITIYEDYNWFSINGFTNAKKLSTMRNSAHCRLSIDNKTLWNNFDYQLRYNRKKQIIFHDYDISFLDNRITFIKNVIKDNNIEGIGFKFPINIYNQEEILDWLDIPLLSEFKCFLLFCDFDDEFLYEYSKDSRFKRLSKNFIWYVTSTSSSPNDFILNHLQKIYRQISFLRREQYKISLKCEEGFAPDSFINSLVFLIGAYGKSGKCNNEKEYLTWLTQDSLVKYLKTLSRNELYTSKLLKDWNLFTQTYPDLVAEFRQTGGIEFINGRFEYGRKAISY